MSFADYCLFAIASPVLRGPGRDGVVRLRIPRRRARRRTDRRVRRNHPRRRLDDLPARPAEIRRAAAVHVFRHHQAGEAANASDRQAAAVAGMQFWRSARPLPSRPARGWRDYALLLALACCWSSTYPLTKIGLGSIPPITFISARSLTAALFLLIDPAPARHPDADRRQGLEAVCRSSRPSIRRSRS